MRTCIRCTNFIAPSSMESVFCVSRNLYILDWNKEMGSNK